MSEHLPSGRSPGSMHDHGVRTVGGLVGQCHLLYLGAQKGHRGSRSWAMWHKTPVSLHEGAGWGLLCACGTAQDFPSLGCIPTPGHVSVPGAQAEAGHLEDCVSCKICCETKKGANDGDYLLSIVVLVPVLIGWTSLDSLPQQCITTGVIPLRLWPDFAAYKSLM